MYAELTNQLKEEATYLLERKIVDSIICYQKGTDCFRATPLFVDTKNQIEKIVFSAVCTNNLVVYLKEELAGGRKVGIVLKGCDSKALVELLKENIIPRDRIYIIGVACNGCLNFEKILNACRRKIDERYFSRLELEIVDGEVNVLFENKPAATFSKIDLLEPKCYACDNQLPVIYDKLFGKVEETFHREYEEKQVTPKMFENCIRCHACRQICPLCYCEECAFDPTQISITPDTTITQKLQRPRWVERTPTLSDNLFYHIGRLYHLAGRCINCGECARACPMKMPFATITQQLEIFIKKCFDYKPGINPAEKPLLTFFKDTDADVSYEG